jgi:hypothetical protein
VVKVEQFGKRFAVEVAVEFETGLEPGATVVVGIADLLRSWSDGRKAAVAVGVVVDSGAERVWCNVEPRDREGLLEGPRIGDAVLIQRPRVPVEFILAKHVVLHEDAVIPWDAVEHRLVDLRRQGPIAPSIWITRNALPQAGDKQKQFAEWCRAATGGDGCSFGSVSYGVSDYYDAITGPADLQPDPARKRDGRVLLDGRPVSNVEIVMQIGAPKFIKMVHLANGRLRDPHNEPFKTKTEVDGQFTLYPPVDRFQLLAVHPRGMAIVTSDEWSESPDIILQPWGSVSGHFAETGAFDEGVHFDTLHRSTGWAELRLCVWETPLHADGRFKNRRIAPGAVQVSRTVKSPRGGSTSSVVETVGVLPGETQEVTIPPLAGDTLRQAEEYLRKEMER